MPSSEAPLLHVGYHKTGTTWLQQHLFGTTSLCMAVQRRRLISDFVLVDPLQFDAEALALKYSAEFERVAATGARPVLSAERLSTPQAGGRGLLRGTGGEFSVGDSRTVADRLAAAFPNARLLIVIREQEGMLLSWYKQYVRIGGSMSLRQYTSNPQIGSNAASFLFRFEILEYDRLIAHYHAAFSGNAPLVLPFELLAADPDAFVAEIARHAGADPPSLPSSTRANVSSSALATSLVRRGNRLLVREPRNVLAAGRATRANRALRRVGERVARSLPASARRRHEDRFTDEVRTLIGDRYAASNRRTAELTGLDLRDWGYKL